MKYTALTYKDAPKTPGIYKITYLSDQSIYIGVTRNLRNRFCSYHRFSGIYQWRLNLCKDNLLSETFSLQNVFKMTAFLYDYEILKSFDFNVSNAALKEAEEYYYDLLKPTLNTNYPNYFK
jgi:excinuclease UvrABC nuclease subunit